MSKNSVQCDACCKVHPVEDEYDAQHLPQGWFAAVPGPDGGFKETLHFCSTGCLEDWALKTARALINIVPAYEVQELMRQQKERRVSDGTETNEALDHVEYCMDMLHTGITVGLHPQEAANGPVGLQSQKEVVESVKEDFKKLSDAIKALRKQ